MTHLEVSRNKLQLHTDNLQAGAAGGFPELNSETEYLGQNSDLV